VCIVNSVILYNRNYFVVFFFDSFSYCYSYICYLISFPTRRSSDLEPCGNCRSFRPLRSGPRRGTPAGALSGDSGRKARRAVAPRSEEHTSELQSRENLVCRLLLEKKKQKFIRLLRLDFFVKSRTSY